MSADNELLIGSKVIFSRDVNLITSWGLIQIKKDSEGEIAEVKVELCSERIGYLKPGVAVRITAYVCDGQPERRCLIIPIDAIKPLPE